MRRKFLATALLLSVCYANTVQAQKTKVTQTEVTKVCTDLPLDKRPRVSVARFNVTSPAKPDGQFGDNLASMLSNALQNSGCYNVLERLKDSSDMFDEMKFGEGSNADKKTSLKRGKMKIANVIITGEITKFEASNSSTGVTLLKLSSAKAKIGVLIKLLNPETREIITSQEFNAEKKVSGGMKFGARLPLFGDVNLTSTSMQNPAVQSATEEAILEAVTFISNQREKIPLPPPSNPTDDASSSVVTVNNISYDQLTALSEQLQKISGVSNVNSDDYANNTATLIIDHKLKSNKELIDKIMAIKAVTLSVTSMNKDGVVFSAAK